MASEHSDNAFPTPTIAAARQAKPPTATQPSPFARRRDAARLWLRLFFFGLSLPFGLGDRLADFDLACFLLFFSFFCFLSAFGQPSAGAA